MSWPKAAFTRAKTAKADGIQDRGRVKDRGNLPQTESAPRRLHHCHFDIILHQALIFIKRNIYTTKYDYEYAKSCN